jgi:hypothetical protein
LPHSQITDARAVPRHHGHRPSPSRETATAILTAYAAGAVSAIELAARHGLADATVRSILRGEVHADAPGPRLSAERLQELAARHVADGRRLAGATQKRACPGCGEKGHPVTQCPDPRGMR